MRSSRSPVPRPWVAETGNGSPRPSPCSSAVRWASSARSTLLATTRTGTSAAAQGRAPARRRRRARPARASATIRTTSASAIPSRAWCWMSRASSSSSARSMPPVSSSSKATPFHSVATRLRSRVTPGWAWVTASRPPASRLTRVLLPTLGKPTMATVGRLRDGSCHAPLVGERDDAGDDLVSGEAGGVELDRVVGGRRAPCSRVASRRRGGAGRRGPPRSSPLWAARRRARSSSEAVRKTFSGESGLTTVPMSRPSATKSPAAISSPLARRPSPRARPGGPRPARRPRSPRARGSPSPTSSPSSATRLAVEADPQARAPSARSPRRRRGRRPGASAASATQRYIAPESR